MELVFQHLPYLLEATWDALKRVIERHNALPLSPLTKISLRPGNTLVLSPAQTSGLSFALDTFLECARRVQNAVVPYVSRALRLSLPASLATLASDLSAGRRSINDDLDQLMLAYWSDSGRILRDYRDLSQHFTMVSSDARLLAQEDGSVLIHVVLPNNSSEVRPSHLKYESPYVHAVPYCVASFRALYIFASEVCYALAAALGPLDTLTMTIHFRPFLSAGAFEGVKAIDLAALETDLTGLSADLRQHLRQHRGAIHPPPSSA